MLHTILEDHWFSNQFSAILQEENIFWIKARYLSQKYLFCDMTALVKWGGVKWTCGPGTANPPPHRRGHVVLTYNITTEELPVPVPGANLGHGHLGVTVSFCAWISRWLWVLCDLSALEPSMYACYVWQHNITWHHGWGISEHYITWWFKSI